MGSALQETQAESSVCSLALGGLEGVFFKNQGKEPGAEVTAILTLLL